LNTHEHQYEAVGRSVKETAEKSGVCRSIVYEEIASGRLKARKLGRRTIILESDRRAWLESLPVVKASKAGAA
jgi:excisionase family DNA binding protein